MEIPNADSIIRGEINQIKPMADENTIAASNAQKAPAQVPPTNVPSVTVSISQEGLRMAKEASANEESNTATDSSDKALTKPSENVENSQTKAPSTTNDNPESVLTKLE